MYFPKTDIIRGFDNLLIDMNGMFHPVAQKVFGYGKYTKPLLLNTEPTNQQFFEEVGRELDRLVAICPPTKRLVLCVDGVAPVAKQVQQRQRRYKSKLESGFDPNSLTPGTQLMTDLCAFVEKYVSKYPFEVIFSSAAVPGEGEMKLMNFVKFYSSASEKSVVYGLDADILLLSLCASIHNRKMFVLRERDTDFTFVDVMQVRGNLVSKLKWSSPIHPFSDTAVIRDFVFMCFLVGNDFLKRAPGIDIITGSIELIIQAYIDTGTEYGHITDGSSFVKDSLSAFFVRLGNLEQLLFDIKAKNISQYIPDPLFNKYNGSGFDLQGYKKEYYSSKFTSPVNEVIDNYLEGLEWVLGYYIDGIPSWKWFYPYSYSPFLSDVAKYTNYKKKAYGRTVPYDPLLQLLLVLPPRSMDLLPAPLNNLYKKFPDLFPTSVVVDAGGKRHEYEGEVLLPAINSPTLISEYYQETSGMSNVPQNSRTSKSLYNKRIELILL